MKRTKKQDEFFEAFRSGKYSTYFLGGGTGSSKSVGAIMIINAICESCPNSRIAVYRKSEKILKNNLIPSFRKVFQMLGQPFDCTDMRIKYKNGSEILFLWADISKDPDCDNAKGGEWTGAFFDEINQIDQKYYEITKTRVGRWNNFEVNGKKFTLKPFIIATCNPTNNWVKSIFYDKNQDGTLPDNVFFQLSLPQDNPFLSKDYIDSLSSLPTEEYNRYVLGDWNYSDDTNLLVKYEWLKNCETEEEYEYNDQVRESLGIDVARYGDDRTIFCFEQDGFFYEFKEFTKQDTVETTERAILSMKEKRIGGERVSVDCIGLGAGVLDGLMNKGYPVFPFNSSEKPNESIPFYSFQNRRAEAYWLLREAIKNGEVKIKKNSQLMRELTNIKYIIKDKTIRIESKDEIKKRLGYSPDYADALCIAFYVSRFANRESVLDTGEDFVDNGIRGISF